MMPCYVLVVGMVPLPHSFAFTSGWLRAASKAPRISLQAKEAFLRTLLCFVFGSHSDARSFWCFGVRGIVAIGCARTCPSCDTMVCVSNDKCFIRVTYRVRCSNTPLHVLSRNERSTRSRSMVVFQVLVPVELYNSSSVVFTMLE